LSSNSGVFSLPWSFNRESGNLESISIYPIDDFSVNVSITAMNSMRTSFSPIQTLEPSDRTVSTVFEPNLASTSGNSRLKQSPSYTFFPFSLRNRTRVPFWWSIPSPSHVLFFLAVFFRLWTVVNGIMYNVLQYEPVDRPQRLDA
jgi:hypothetical protein